jgi:hypothetical protein
MVEGAIPRIQIQSTSPENNLPKGMVDESKSKGLLRSSRDV